MNMLLKVNNIKVHYERGEALKGVSLEVMEGTIVCVIGANGAGKSTCLLAVSGLKALTSGEIWFLKKRIDIIPPHTIVNLGISQVPEGRRLFPYMTVLQNLKLGAYLRKGWKDARNTLEEVYGYLPILKQRSRQLAHSLSGGEQQILAIGRSLMANPKLLLLDEPSLGLAPLMVRTVAKLIKDINKAGISILLVEQSARLALDIADKGYLLKLGEVVLEGYVEELKRSPLVRRAYLGG
jgi:branched-chain amino acid transport system ATP-binding protein